MVMAAGVMIAAAIGICVVLAAVTRCVRSMLDGGGGGSVDGAEAL